MRHYLHSLGTHWFTCFSSTRGLVDANLTGHMSITIPSHCKEESIWNVSRRDLRRTLQVDARESNLTIDSGCRLTKQVERKSQSRDIRFCLLLGRGKC